MNTSKVSNIFFITIKQGKIICDQLAISIGVVITRKNKGEPK